VLPRPIAMPIVALPIVALPVVARPVLARPIVAMPLIAMDCCAGMTRGPHAIELDVREHTFGGTSA